MYMPHKGHYFYKFDVEDCVGETIAHLAACANRFLMLGAFGSASRDRVVSNSLLETIDTDLRLLTI